MTDEDDYTSHPTDSAIVGDFSAANWNEGPTMAEAVERFRDYPVNDDGSVTFKIAPFLPRSYDFSPRTDILALQDKINEDIRRLATLAPYRHTVFHDRVFVEGYVPEQLPICDRPIPAEGQE